MLMMIVLGVFLIVGVQPMLMISVMIVIVMIYSYSIYVMMGGYWFGYALMLVMLSGVLVVFTYMISLVPNESFENLNLNYMLGVVVFIGGLYYLWMYSKNVSYISLMLWNSFFSYFNMFMISFLLMIMLMTVWFSYMGCGALRIW